MTTSQSLFPKNRAGRRALGRNRSGALGAAGVLAVGSAGALLAAFAGSAGAATTITVDSNADGTATAANCTDGTPGNCTLRDAAAQANDGDTINFTAGISAISLTNVVEFDAVNIVGPGSANLTISTTNAPGNTDTFYIAGTGDVTVSGITVTTNRISSKNVGNLTLDDVTISGSTGGYGGALYAGNTGDLDIIDSNFDDNNSSSKAGAVYAYNGGATTITGCTFTNNDAGLYGSGGAVYVDGGDITVTDSTFTGNSAGYQGGGLTFSEAVSVSITRTTISDNTTISDSEVGGDGGGLSIVANSPTGAILIDSSTISGNNSPRNGGGLNLYNLSGFTMLNSTVSGNSAVDGAGLKLNQVGDVLIANSTIADNTGDADVGYGGALYFQGLTGDVELLFTTISGNSANGETIRIGGYDGYSVDLTGTIISDNTTSTGSGILATDISSGDQASGLLTLTNSLVMGTIDTAGEVDGGGNLFGVSALLGDLADNGGLTKTMALLTGSPAIDTGPLTWTAFTGDGFDQRATPYVRVYGSSADMGAYESESDPEPTSTTTTGVDPVVPAFTG